MFLAYLAGKEYPMDEKISAPHPVRRSTIELLVAAEQELKKFEQMQKMIRIRHYGYNEEEAAKLKLSVGQFEVSISNSNGLGEAIIQAQIDRLRGFLTSYGVSL